MLLARINRDKDDSRRAWLVGHPCADTREWTPASDTRITPSRQQQMDTGAEWPERMGDDRGNQGVDVAVQTTRAFSSAIEAWRFRMSLVASAENQPHPWKGDVVLRHLLPDDFFEETLLPNAVISADPLIGLGSSVPVGYNIKAGHAQPHRVGQVKQLTAQAASGLPAIMDFFGDKIGGGMTDSVTPDTDIEASGWTIPTGYYMQFDVYSETAATPVSYKYRIGASALAHTQLAYPLDLAELAASIGSSDYISTELVVVGGRQAVRFSITDALGGPPWPDGLAGTRIRVRIRASSDLVTLLKYDGSTYGDAVREHRLTIGGKPLLVDVAA